LVNILFISSFAILGLILINIPIRFYLVIALWIPPCLASNFAFNVGKAAAQLGSTWINSFWRTTWPAMRERLNESYKLYGYWGLTYEISKIAGGSIYGTVFTQ